MNNGSTAEVIEYRGAHDMDILLKMEPIQAGALPQVHSNKDAENTKTRQQDKDTEQVEH